MTSKTRLSARPEPCIAIVTGGGRGIGRALALACAREGLDTEDEWLRILAVNLTSIFYFTQAVLPDMEAANWGRIINMSSAAGRMGVPFAVPYNATKHGVIGFTRGLALDLARTGITVNAICPGWVRTDMTRANAEGLAAKKGIPYEQALASLISSSPQRRLIEPEEVAHVAIMLLSEAARSITGQEIGIDGGIVVA